MSGLWRFLKCLPIVIIVGAPLAIFLTYGLAVLHHHVTPLLPYVSDTGTLPPESCYFTFIFSSFSFLLICATYVRQREVSEITRLKPNINIKPSCNRAAFAIAIFSAVGLNIVASFQESNNFRVHFSGALMCFFGGTTYFIFQTESAVRFRQFNTLTSGDTTAADNNTWYLLHILDDLSFSVSTIFTRRINPEAKKLFYVRIFLTVVNILCTAGTFAPLHFALVNFKGDNFLKWTAKDGGYEYHILSTVSEWSLIFSFAAYICTLYWDFRKFHMEPPAIIFHDIETKVAAAPPEPEKKRATSSV